MNEWNQKDEILIHHLLAEQPWKARHGHAMATWDSLLENVLTDKRDRVCVFDGVSVTTICNQYEQVYLYRGKTWTKEKEQRNQQEASGEYCCILLPSKQLCKLLKNAAFTYSTVQLGT